MNTRTDERPDFFFCPYCGETIGERDPHCDEIGHAVRACGEAIDPGLARCVLQEGHKGPCEA